MKKNANAEDWDKYKIQVKNKLKYKKLEKNASEKSEACVTV